MGGTEQYSCMWSSCSGCAVTGVYKCEWVNRFHFQTILKHQQRSETELNSRNMAKIKERIVDLEEKTEELENRTADFEQTTHDLETRTNELEQQIEDLEARIIELEEKFPSKTEESDNEEVEEEEEEDDDEEEEVVEVKKLKRRLEEVEDCKEVGVKMLKNGC
ncbi:histone H3.v1-like [Pimephales promelas]|uniref:histone H3.v1-like n=1 Tax=Pimephales promelas TaxID=90988 RepID=UPI001955CCD0|nr:histone H3.v1-like [Pimephales promelas]